MTAWHWLAEWWPMVLAALVSAGYLGWRWRREGGDEQPWPDEENY